jgi:polyhydroxybutyrate depolymerase
MLNKISKSGAAIFLLVLLFMIFPRTASQPSPNKMKPGTYELNLNSQGHKWQYVLHVPPQYNPRKPTPLVLILHGFGGNGRAVLNLDGWKNKANVSGFIAVAPNGLPAQPLLPKKTRVWNTGGIPPSNPRSKIDDVKFFSTLLDNLESNLNIDKKRIYVTGHSNGGSLTFLLGAKLSNRLTAIAPVSGPLLLKNPQLTRPIPTLYIIGKSDPIVPFAGGETELPWGVKRNTPPVMTFLANWAMAMGCRPQPQSLKSNNNFEVISYNGCEKNSKFIAYFINGQGHAWPGGHSELPTSVTGPSTNKLNATEVIWDFFQQQTR